MEALEKIVPDLEEKEYISEMIKEENPQDFDTLWELLQDFLEELDSSNAKSHCKEILHLIAPATALAAAAAAQSQQAPSGNAAGGSSGSFQVGGSEPSKKPMLLGDMLKTGHEDSVGFKDEFMGLGDKKANYNECVAIADLVKERRTQNVKERAAVMNRMKQWQSSKLKPPAPVRIHRGEEQIGKVYHTTSSLVLVTLFFSKELIV